MRHPIHLPETGLEPGRFVEDFLHGGKPRLAAAPGPEIVQRRRRAARNRLIFLARIHLDPGPVGVVRHRFESAERPADLAVTDDAGRERNMQIQKVAAQAGLQHIARIGEAARRFRRGSISASVRPQEAQNSTCGNAGQHLRGRADVRQGLGLVGGERPGPREMDEEQIILDQVMPERRFRQAAGAQLPDEIVPDIGVPVRPGAGPQPVEQSAFVNRFSRSNDHIAATSCGRPSGRYATGLSGACPISPVQSIRQLYRQTGPPRRRFFCPAVLGRPQFQTFPAVASESPRRRKRLRPLRRPSPLRAFPAGAKRGPSLRPLCCVPDSTCAAPRFPRR